MNEPNYYDDHGRIGMQFACALLGAGVGILLTSVYKEVSKMRQRGDQLQEEINIASEAVAKLNQVGEQFGLTAPSNLWIPKEDDTVTVFTGTVGGVDNTTMDLEVKRFGQVKHDYQDHWKGGQNHDGDKKPAYVELGDGGGVILEVVGLPSVDYLSEDAQSEKDAVQHYYDSAMERLYTLGAEDGDVKVLVLVPDLGLSEGAVKYIEDEYATLDKVMVFKNNIKYVLTDVLSLGGSTVIVFPEDMPIPGEYQTSVTLEFNVDEDSLYQVSGGRLVVLPNPDSAMSYQVRQIVSELLSRKKFVTVLSKGRLYEVVSYTPPEAGG